MTQQPAPSGTKLLLYFLLFVFYALFAGFGDVTGSTTLWHPILYANCTFPTHDFDDSKFGAAVNNASKGCPTTPLVSVPVGVGAGAAFLFGGVALDLAGKWIRSGLCLIHQARKLLDFLDYSSKLSELSC